MCTPAIDWNKVLIGVIVLGLGAAAGTTSSYFAAPGFAQQAAGPAVDRELENHKVKINMLEEDVEAIDERLDGIEDDVDDIKHGVDALVTAQEQDDATEAEWRARSSRQEDQLDAILEALQTEDP